MGCSLQARYTDAAAQTHGQANCGGILQCNPELPLAVDHRRSPAGTTSCRTCLACPWQAPSLIRPRHNSPECYQDPPHFFSDGLACWAHSAKTAWAGALEATTPRSTSQAQHHSSLFFPSLLLSTTISLCSALLVMRPALSLHCLSLLPSSLISSSKRVRCRKALTPPRRQGTAATWRQGQEEAGSGGGPAGGPCRALRHRPDRHRGGAAQLCAVPGGPQGAKHLVLSSRSSLIESGACLSAPPELSPGKPGRLPGVWELLRCQHWSAVNPGACPHSVITHCLPRRASVSCLCAGAAICGLACEA